ncbi:MAG: hypothetical protein AAF382_04150 [Pseudomonadota bacterium]
MSKFILKFKEVSVQPSDPTGVVVKRAIGFVNIKELLPLLDSRSLAPNPRSAKKNAIIEGILGTLNSDPELFRFKSKGLLISSHKVEELERNRFRLEFNKDFVDGVLDGGHNLFAIGIFVLSQVAPEKELQRVRTWDDLDEIWSEYRDAIQELEFDTEDLVAVELIFPPKPNDESLDAFDQIAFDISQARNANTQVKTEAFQNKLGFYDVLKEALPEELGRRVEWKPGVVEASDAKPISVRDIVALAWIPLNLANEHKLLPTNISVSPQNIYSRKGECSDKFNALMKLDAVTEPIGGKAGQARQLKHKAVESCLRITADLPRLFDLIYEKFPSFYNDGGANRFGSRTIVKIFDPDRIKELKAAQKDVSGYTAIRPVTPFFQRSSAELKYKYPEGLIIPFVTGLSALMTVENGEIVWAVEDIDMILLSKLEKAAPLFDGQLDAYSWDPQKLAKNLSSHKQAASYYKVL